MIAFRTQTIAQICGTKNAWSLETKDSNTAQTKIEAGL
jgi:hypothetical protein